MTVNPYLNFDGNAKEAMDFYKSVFGGEFAVVQKFSDMPPGPGSKPSPEEANRIMHIALPIGKDGMLMASDIAPSMGHKLTIGNNIYISLNPESKEEGERLYKGLSDGAKKIEMEFAKMFWGGWFGSFTDKFGICWMINYQEDPLPGK